MNQLEKVREAVLAYDKAVQHKNDAATAMREAEGGLRGASKELVRVLSHMVPGKAVIMEGLRYDVRDGGLIVVTCDDVVL